MPNTCPWDQYSQATQLWCETSLCSWIKQPSNSWSTLAYVIVGFLIFIHSKKNQAKHLSVLGIISILIGLTSFYYHMSLIRFSEFLDYSSMYLFSSMVIMFNLYRLKILNLNNRWFVYLIIVFISAGSVLLFQNSGLVMFPIHVIGIFVTEYLCFKKQTENVNRKNYFIWMYTFLFSTVIWFLDTQRVFCNPHNHIIQGHAIWHVGTGASLWFMYRFYQKNFRN